jgi:hypothetical protein
LVGFALFGIYALFFFIAAGFIYAKLAKQTSE